MFLDCGLGLFQLSSNSCFSFSAFSAATWELERVLEQADVENVTTF
jgi:hypothetical protein